MNKFAKGLLITALSTSVLAVAACGNEDSSAKKSDDTEQTATATQEEKQEAPKSKYPFPSSTEAKGDATMVLTTDGGTSENGKAPVVFANDSDLLIQIGLDVTKFDGSKQSFIYIDKIFSEADQYGEETSTTVSLEQEKGHLKPGVHTVSIVQFENDDPEKGAVTTYQEAKYEIKEKK
ncbi:hypothetical protein SFC65_19945 [Priestia filamentosa]|uniref:hypothetical protein n=1 Tax=Priestia filamentosa TaxID=1402861 RepID=UPI003981AF0E